jgi:hypothetical protein
MLAADQSLPTGWRYKQFLEGDYWRYGQGLLPVLNLQRRGFYLSPPVADSRQCLHPGLQISVRLELAIIFRDLLTDFSGATLPVRIRDFGWRWRAYRHSKPGPAKNPAVFHFPSDVVRAAKRAEIYGTVSQQDVCVPEIFESLSVIGSVFNDHFISSQLNLQLGLLKSVPCLGFPKTEAAVGSGRRGPCPGLR